jgi:hypothetical protein
MHVETYTDDYRRWEHTFKPGVHGVHAPFTLQATRDVLGQVSFVSNSKEQDDTRKITA